MQSRESLPEELSRLITYSEPVLSALDIGISIQRPDFTVIYQNKRHKDLFGDRSGTICFRAFVQKERTCGGCPLSLTFQDGRTHTSEQKKTTAHGIFYWEATSCPLRDATGSIVAGAVMVRDISPHKRRDEELRRIEKLESLKVIASGIAHDFNNILTSIMGNISLAQIYIRSGKSPSENLVDAEKATLHARHLTNQLLTFAKGGATSLKTTSIAEIIKDAVGFALHGSNVKSRLSLAEGLWPVEIDEGQVSQVFHNLFINAAQAMPEGGVISIEAENEIIEAESSVSLKEGRYIRVSINDKGVGIPQSHISRIFDPFFTTKQRGSGLGLATSHSIIRSHNGLLTVDSSRYIGTTFNIFLPASDKEISAVKETTDETFSGKGRILFMDDDKGIRKTAARILRLAGYEVETTGDGLEAIRLFREAREKLQPFTAVLLDLTIPGGMGGKETLARLRELDPDIKVIVSSGYIDDAAIINYRDFGFTGAICKPYRPQELGRALHDILNPGTGQHRDSEKEKHFGDL